MSQELEKDEMWNFKAVQTRPFTAPFWRCESADEKSTTPSPVSEIVQSVNLIDSTRKKW